MATVQIPIGGRMVGIDIPPLDINDMGQLVQYSADQVNLLSAIAGAMGSQTQAINNLSSRLPSGGGGGGGGGSGGGGGGFSSGGLSISRGMEAAANAISKSGARLSDIVNGLFTDLNMPQLGAGVGTILGILEEFGNSMQMMNRIGAGVGQNFIELRNKAAEVGLSLGDLSKLSKESGVTVGALGKNTKDGVDRLLKFTSALRTSTEAAGYYGMGSAELAQYMADELEVRRQQGDANSLRTINETALAKAMNENLAAQTAMASLTGQDVRDRLKAQQDYRKDAQARALMTTLTEAQSDALVKAQSSLSVTGSAAPVISKAIERALVGLPADMATQGAYQAAQTAGLDMRGFVDAAVAAIQSGNASQVEALSTAFAGQLKNTTFSRSQIQQGYVGNNAYSEGSLAIFGAAGTAISTGATTTDQAATQNAAARASFDAAVQDGSAAFLGLTTNLETATISIKNAASNAMLAAAGIDVTNLNTAQQGFNDLAKSMAELPDNPFFHAMLTMLSTAAIVGTGARGVFNAAGLGSNEEHQGRWEQGGAWVRSREDEGMLMGQLLSGFGTDPNNPLMRAIGQARTAIVAASGVGDLAMNYEPFRAAVDSLRTETDTAGTALNTFAGVVNGAANIISNAFHLPLSN
jgi:hypothetical protein